MSVLFFKQLCIICLFILLGACGVTIQGIDVGRVVGAGAKAMDVGEKSEADEILMGEKTAEALLAEAPLANDEQLQIYVNRVGYWLAQQSGRPDLPWHFVVLNNSAVNAFAAPGGYVFITTGMLDIIYNEAELAGALAHEIAHVVDKHYLNALQSKAQTGLLTDVLVLSQQASRSQDERDSSSTSITGQYDKLVSDVYNRGLDRDDEYRADELGAVIAARAGYDHYGFASVLQHVDGADDDNDALPGFLNRHPDTAERLAALEGTLLYLDDNSSSYRVLASRYASNSRVSLN
jgi:predicted Zn-dependent protease